MVATCGAEAVAGRVGVQTPKVTGIGLRAAVVGPAYLSHYLRLRSGPLSVTHRGPVVTLEQLLGPLAPLVVTPRLAASSPLTVGAAVTTGLMRPRPVEVVEVVAWREREERRRQGVRLLGGTLHITLAFCTAEQGSAGGREAAGASTTQ